MYESMREQKNTYMPPALHNQKQRDTKVKQHYPYEGKPLQVSGGLAEHIQHSFGLQASELSLRESPEVAKMGARAMAQGNTIRFAPGEFRPNTKEGMQVLGHELNHVKEQALGMVHAPGGQVFEHAGHEAASDAAGAAFASGSMASAVPVSVGGMHAAAAPAQGLFGWMKNKWKKKDEEERMLRNYHENYNFEGVPERNTEDSGTDLMMRNRQEGIENGHEMDDDWIVNQEGKTTSADNIWKNASKKEKKRAAKSELKKAERFDGKEKAFDARLKQAKQHQLYADAGIFTPKGYDEVNAPQGYIPLEHNGRSTSSFSNKELHAMARERRHERRHQRQEASNNRLWENYQSGDYRTGRAVDRLSDRQQEFLHNRIQQERDKKQAERNGASAAPSVAAAPAKKKWYQFWK